MGNPFVVLMIGIYLGGLILEDDATIVDQLYFSFISMSTIGCGLARFLISYACARPPSLPPVRATCAAQTAALLHRGSAHAC